MAVTQAPLQRCAQRCQDKAQGQLPVNPKDKDMRAAQARYLEPCWVLAHEMLCMSVWLPNLCANCGLHAGIHGAVCRVMC